MFHDRLLLLARTYKVGAEVGSWKLSEALVRIHNCVWGLMRGLCCEEKD